jgi:multidrug transporter EmrE-like cation transporter
MKIFMLTYGLIILSALLDSYAAFVVKTRFNEFGHFDYSSVKGFFLYLYKLLKSPLAFSALIAFVMAPGFWFLALNRLDLSIGYPILVGFHLLFVFVFGYFLLHESMNTNKLIGCGLALLSIYFYYRST